MIKKEIQKYIPEFTLDYDVDPVRQTIADTWPDNIDTSYSRKNGALIQSIIWLK